MMVERARGGYGTSDRLDPVRPQPRPRMMKRTRLVPLAAVPAPAQVHLGTMIAGYAQEHGLSGTVLVHAGGQQRYHQSFGVAERAFGTPADNETRYRVASITRLFTAALVMQLHQEGRIHVDSTIRAYLPDYPGEGADRVTLHQLLNHTSGLEAFDRERSFQEAVENGIERYQKPHTAAALLARAAAEGW
jgi:D-alanyl-D-alanine carboxypeptidase